MTDEQRTLAEVYLDAFTLDGLVTLPLLAKGPEAAEAIRQYRAEHERMRQFIHNLADESRVYLESDE